MTWEQRSQIFRTMPVRSRLFFFAGVAGLFAAVGTMTDALNLEASTPSRFLSTILLTSVASALWAFLGSMRMRKSLIVMAFAQLAVLVLTIMIFRPSSRPLTIDQWRSQIIVHSGLTLAFIYTGYALLVVFFRREGARFFSAHTEIELASRIQERLVPPISKQIWGYEIFGVSRPSGVVGGDLLDVVEGNEMACAYVADVAGHGVAAGVLMSMVKAAMRMRFQVKSDNRAELLESMNEVLYPLTENTSYATFACVLISSEPHLIFCVAAHPPIFHFRRNLKTVEHRSIENFPVGMFKDKQFDTGEICVEPGDIVAIITDGVAEVFDSRGEELGYRHVEESLKELFSRPLPEIVDQIIGRTTAFGRVTDDRTLLLLRYC